MPSAEGATEGAIAVDGIANQAPRLSPMVLISAVPRLRSRIIAQEIGSGQPREVLPIPIRIVDFIRHCLDRL